MAEKEKANVRNVKLNTPMVGNRLKDGKFAGHFSYAKGDTVELPTAEAQRYVERGMATYADAIAK